MNQNLKYFTKFAKQTTTNEAKLDYEIDINNHITLLNELTTETGNIIHNYLQSISLINHGIINFELLHPTSLLNELRLITSHYELPIEPTLENAYLYYKIIKTNTFIRNNLLV